jgi:phage-related protein
MMKQKSLVWLHGEVKTPPFSAEARIEAGFRLRTLQQGAKLTKPHSKPMTTICTKCHELIIEDNNKSWRIIYRLDDDAVVILEVFEKKSQKTPRNIIAVCKARLTQYDS